MKLCFPYFLVLVFYASKPVVSQVERSRSHLRRLQALTGANRPSLQGTFSIVNGVPSIQVYGLDRDLGSKRFLALWPIEGDPMHICTHDTSAAIDVYECPVQGISTIPLYLEDPGLIRSTEFLILWNVDKATLKWKEGSSSIHVSRALYLCENSKTEFNNVLGLDIVTFFSMTAAKDFPLQYDCMPIPQITPEDPQKPTTIIQGTMGNVENVKSDCKDGSFDLFGTICVAEIDITEADVEVRVGFRDRQLSVTLHKITEDVPDTLLRETCDDITDVHANLRVAIKNFSIINNNHWRYNRVGLYLPVLARKTCTYDPSTDLRYAEWPTGMLPLPNLGWNIGPPEQSICVNDKNEGLIDLSSDNSMLDVVLKRAANNLWRRFVEKQLTESFESGVYAVTKYAQSIARSEDPAFDIRVSMRNSESGAYYKLGVDFDATVNLLGEDSEEAFPVSVLNQIKDAMVKVAKTLSNDYDITSSEEESENDVEKTIRHIGRGETVSFEVKDVKLETSSSGLGEDPMYEVSFSVDSVHAQYTSDDANIEFPFVLPPFDLSVALKGVDVRVDKPKVNVAMPSFDDTADSPEGEEHDGHDSARKVLKDNAVYVSWPLLKFEIGDKKYLKTEIKDFGIFFKSKFIVRVVHMVTTAAVSTRNAFGSIARRFVGNSGGLSMQALHGVVGMMIGRTDGTDVSESGSIRSDGEDAEDRRGTTERGSVPCGIFSMLDVNGTLPVGCAETPLLVMDEGEVISFSEKVFSEEVGRLDRYEGQSLGPGDSTLRVEPVNEIERFEIWYCKKQTSTSTNIRVAFRRKEDPKILQYYIMCPKSKIKPADDLSGSQSSNVIDLDLKEISTSSDWVEVNTYTLTVASIENLVSIQAILVQQCNAFGSGEDSDELRVRDYGDSRTPTIEGAAEHTRAFMNQELQTFKENSDRRWFSTKINPKDYPIFWASDRVIPFVGMLAVGIDTIAVSKLKVALRYMITHEDETKTTTLHLQLVGAGSKAPNTAENFLAYETRVSECSSLSNDGIDIEVYNVRGKLAHDGTLLSYLVDQETELSGLRVAIEGGFTTKIVVTEGKDVKIEYDDTHFCLRKKDWFLLKEGGSQHFGLNRALSFVLPWVHKLITGNVKDALRDVIFCFLEEGMNGAKDHSKENMHKAQDKANIGRPSFLKRLLIAAATDSGNTLNGKVALTFDVAKGTIGQIDVSVESLAVGVDALFAAFTGGTKGGVEADILPGNVIDPYEFPLVRTIIKLLANLRSWGIHWNGDEETGESFCDPHGTAAVKPGEMTSDDSQLKLQNGILSIDTNATLLKVGLGKSDLSDVEELRDALANILPGPLFPSIEFDMVQTNVRGLSLKLPITKITSSIFLAACGEENTARSEESTAEARTWEDEGQRSLSRICTFLKRIDDNFNNSNRFEFSVASSDICLRKGEGYSSLDPFVLTMKVNAGTSAEDAGEYFKFLMNTFLLPEGGVPRERPRTWKEWGKNTLSWAKNAAQNAAQSVVHAYTGFTGHSDWRDGLRGAQNALLRRSDSDDGRRSIEI